MYVDNGRASDVMQLHLLREGLTQSVGLARDSPRYPASIFQSELSQVTAYASIDKELIRLLYHPDMVVGVDSLGSEAILRAIFRKENSD